MQAALTERLTDAVMAQVDVQALVDDVAGALDERGTTPRAADGLRALEAPLTGAVRSFVHDAARRLVRSDTFATAWEQLNRRAHTELVAVLRGEDGTLLTVTPEGALAVDLGGLVELLRQRLLDRGLTAAALLPAVQAPSVVLAPDRFAPLQQRYGQVVTLTTWLPWLVAALLAAGVLSATRRVRALLVAALAVVAGTAVLGVVLTVGRGTLLGALAGSDVAPDAAAAVLDRVVVQPVRDLARASAAVAALVALAAAAAPRVAGLVRRRRTLPARG